MTLTTALARQLLKQLPGQVSEGLREDELSRVELTYGFAFNPDHRLFLQTGLPVGPQWPDWRDGDLRDWLYEPIKGVLFDVEENDFWWPEWGQRPVKTTVALARAGAAMARVPRLIPVYGHRFAPALPQTGLPVLSVMQTDVVVYGSDFADYVQHEFDLGSHEAERPVWTVPFWGELDSA